MSIISSIRKSRSKRDRTLGFKGDIMDLSFYLVILGVGYWTGMNYPAIGLVLMISFVDLFFHWLGGRKGE